jgi:hypothetical protein
MVMLESPLSCPCGGVTFRLQRARNDDPEGLPDEWSWSLAALCTACGALAVSLASAANGTHTVKGALVPE